MIERFDNKQDRSRGNQKSSDGKRHIECVEVTCTKTWIKLGNFTSLNDYFRLSYFMINYQYHKNTFLGLRRYKAYLWSSDRPAF